MSLQRNTRSTPEHIAVGPTLVLADAGAMALRIIHRVAITAPKEGLTFVHTHNNSHKEAQCFVGVVISRRVRNVRNCEPKQVAPHQTFSVEGCAREYCVDTSLPPLATINAGNIIAAFGTLRRHKSEELPELVWGSSGEQHYWHRRFAAWDFGKQKTEESSSLGNVPNPTAATLASANYRLV